MGDVEAVKNITKSTQCPIVIVTSSVAEHGALASEAMGLGALDASKILFWELGNEVTDANELPQISP